MKPRVALACVFLLSAACSNSTSPGGPSGTLTFRLDPTVTPVASSIPDGTGAPRVLGAVRDSAGTTSSFVIDEVIVSPASQAELDAFVARYRGAVVGNDAVPAPPADLGVTVDPKNLAATQYVVKLDPSKFDVSGFAFDAVHAGFTGDVALSSEAALQLLALAAHEKASGLHVSPNFVGTGAGLMTSTREQPDGHGGFLDAFGIDAYEASGSKSSVSRAWQYVALKPPARRSRVAIVDGGFWLDAQGHPMSVLPNGASDLPAHPWQYDFVQDDYIADGVSPTTCTGGATCNWHGNEAASTAIGRIDDQYGAAGVAGQVANPLLFKTTLDGGSLARTIRTAVAWGADVVSMSFGIDCDNVFCDGFYEGNLFPALRNARDSGVVMVAAAGNGHDVGGGNFVGEEASVLPCRAHEDVICVGAIAAGTTAATGYSNYGENVDIWAPTNIPVMPDGDDQSVHGYGGTSASTPFVAGIAGILKAYDPALTSGAVQTLLSTTAWKDSGDPKVTGYVNAYAALEWVAGNAPPAVTITSPAAGATVTAGGLGYLLHAQVTDLEDGSPCCSVSWSSDVDGDLGTGTAPSFEALASFQSNRAADDHGHREGLEGRDVDRERDVRGRGSHAGRRDPGARGGPGGHARPGAGARGARHQSHGRQAVVHVVERQPRRHAVPDEGLRAVDGVHDRRRTAADARRHRITRRDRERERRDRGRRPAAPGAARRERPRAEPQRDVERRRARRDGGLRVRSGRRTEPHVPLDLDVERAGVLRGHAERPRLDLDAAERELHLRRRLEQQRRPVGAEPVRLRRRHRHALRDRRAEPDELRGGPVPAHVRAAAELKERVDSHHACHLRDPADAPDARRRVFELLDGILAELFERRLTERRWHVWSQLLSERLRQGLPGGPRRRVLRARAGVRSPRGLLAAPRVHQRLPRTEDGHLHQPLQRRQRRPEHPRVRRPRRDRRVHQGSAVPRPGRGQLLLAERQRALKSACTKGRTPLGARRQPIANPEIVSLHTIQEISRGSAGEWDGPRPPEIRA